MRPSVAAAASVQDGPAGTAAEQCQVLVHNRYFQLVLLTALALALFLPDAWVLADWPRGVTLDVLLTSIFLLFAGELVAQCVGFGRLYLKSMSFWMDLVGTGSVLLDLSFFSFEADDVNTDTSNSSFVLFIARMSKLSMRMGRMTRLLKLPRFLPCLTEKPGERSVIPKQFHMTLSNEVACLIIVMVVTLALFGLWTYPTGDWSMSAWLDILERSTGDAEAFKTQLDGFWKFYKDENYFPFRLVARAGHSLPPATAALLPWTAPDRSPPAQAGSIVKQVTSNLACEFNFRRPYMVASLVNIIMLIFIIILLLVSVLVLSRTVNTAASRPLQQALEDVKAGAVHISALARRVQVKMQDKTRGNDALNLQTSQDEGDSLPDQEDNEDVSARELLRGARRRLALLLSITAKHLPDMNEHKVDAAKEERHGLSFFGRYAEAEPGNDEDLEDEWSAEEAGTPKYSDYTRKRQMSLLERASLSLDLIDSVYLNPLELDRERASVVIIYLVGQSHRLSYDAVAMQHFVETAAAGYLEPVRYHNWFHAVDVTHGVYRNMKICCAEAYLSSTERFALLISAVCHDIGHPGLSNPFLIEVSHELALRYNDRSPLESMHCCRLFEIAAQTRTNIFAGLSQQQYREVRKCCVEAILHTDNVHHMAMVKEVQLFCNSNAEAVEAARLCVFKTGGEEGGIYIDDWQILDILRLPETRRLLVKLFLHSADLSNCTKPFHICKAWASRVIEEFFEQGDEERRLGMPVAPLNDRELVVLPMSQIGYVEFLAAPLFFANAQLLPMMAPAAEQMLANLLRWQECWVDETKPDEKEQKVVFDRVLRLEQQLQRITGSSVNNTASEKETEASRLATSRLRSKPGEAGGKKFRSEES